MAESRVLIHHCKLAVAIETGVSIAQQNGRSKFSAIARPRQLAMTLAHELTGQSLVRIGQTFDGRDHTVVMRAKDNIAFYVRNLPAFAQLYKRCRARAIAEAAA